MAQGASADAFEMLRPYREHRGATGEWVAVADGLGQDAEVVEVSAGKVAGRHQAGVGLLAGVLIRNGRTDEAEALLREPPRC